MRNQTLFLIAIIFFAFSASGQELKKTRKVVQLMSEQKFFLNGGIRASFGGKSRTSFEITLPPNTIEWYYTFTTYGAEAPSKESLQLTSQLTRLIDPTGMTSFAVSAILCPTGANSCDILLMDRANQLVFNSKADLEGTKLTYIISGSRQNFRNGVVQVGNVNSGTVYLGFRNPSSSVGIGVSVEVAAIVEEAEGNADTWTIAQKDNLYNSLYTANRAQLKDPELAQEWSRCLVEKITFKTTSREYDQLTQSERTGMIKECINSCSEQLEPKLTAEQEKAINYGNLGWRAYENGDVDRCIELSKIALGMDNTLGFVKANLALCYMIKGDETGATDFYMEALSDIKKMKTQTQRKKYLQAVIDDLVNATKKYNSMKSVDHLLSMMKGELQNL